MLVTARRTWRRVRRGVVAAATVAAMAACAVGVPQRAPILKSHAERYPCENHPCGCADADSCWRECCCMTHAAKLAWAQKNGVTPPAFVVAAVKRERSAPEQPDRTQRASNGTCCSAAAKTCCSSTPQRAEPAGSQIDERTSTDGFKTVLLHAALKCRGLTASIGLLPPSLPPAPSEPMPLPVERFVSASGESLLYDSPSYAVDPPPPDAART